VAILYRATAARPWRRTVLVTGALSLGVALAWLMRPGEPDAGAARPAVARATAAAAVAQPAEVADATCDARCAAAKVEELASFGVRWQDADATRPKFDRFAWLERARGTLTLGGAHAEFRNASGAYLPVDYDCDFDPATLTALQSRARPHAPAQVAGVTAAER
jgi:hypothetical protein